MRISTSNHTLCPLCHHTSLPQRIFLRSLVTRIMKLSKLPDFQNKADPPYDTQREGIARVARLAGATEGCSRPFQQPCLHVKWMRQIKKQLELSFQEIDSLCHQIADSISMRNYHLYLLEQQTKNASETVLKLNRKKLIDNEEKQEKQIVKREDYQGMREEQGVKIEVGRHMGTGHGLILGTEKVVPQKGVQEGEISVSLEYQQNGNPQHS